MYKKSEIRRESDGKVDYLHQVKTFKVRSVSNGIVYLPLILKSYDMEISPMES